MQLGMAQQSQPLNIPISDPFWYHQFVSDEIPTDNNLCLFDNYVLPTSGQLGWFCGTYATACTHSLSAFAFDLKE